MVPDQIILSTAHPGQIRPAMEDSRGTFFWGTPPSDGGSPILSYTLSCAAASISNTYGPTVFSATITGLTNGTEYLFTVYATNADGDGPPTSFRSVQPGFRPGPPRNVAVTSNSSTTATVTWDAPTSDGGATVKWYVIIGVSNNPADPTVKLSAEGTDRLRYITDLNAASNYTYTVFAVNDPGYSSGVSRTIVQSGLRIWLDATAYSGSGTWYDQTTNHFDATLEDGTIAKNVAGNGIVLNGTTSWTFPDIGSLTNWTLSVWFKNTASPDTFAAIVTQIQAGSANMFIWIYPGSPALSYQGGFFDGRSVSQGSSVAFPLTVWKQMVVTWNGTYLITYINSSIASSPNFSGRISGSSGQPYRIGRRWDAPNYVTGEIGQVLIYNRALTEEEVLYNYNVTASTYA